MKIKLALARRVLIYSLIFIGISCRDNVVDPKITNPFLEKIDVQKDPKLLTLISKLYNNGSNPSGRTLTTDFGEVGLDSALKINDTKNQRTRYSLKLKPKAGSFVFENLIIVERQEGIFHYILQYSPDLNWYYQSETTDWNKFTGIIRQYDMSRTLIVEVNLINGKSVIDNSKGGRVEDCNSCTWTVDKAFFTSIININCGAGGNFTVWTKNLRVADCGERGGDSSGTPVGGDGSGSSPSGNVGDGSGTAGANGSSNASQDANSNSIAIYTNELTFPKNWWKDDSWLDDNFSLDPYDKYKKLTAAERALVKRFPGQAIIINLNKDKAFEETNRLFPTSLQLNDKADAFRHAFFNALNDRDLGDEPITFTSIAKLFSDAHETETPSQLILEVQMDLWNNTVGQRIGNSVLNIFASDEDISNQILQQLNNGELRYLNPIWFKDKNFWGKNGIEDVLTATHGITANTMLTPTNQ